MERAFTREIFIVTATVAALVLDIGRAQADYTLTILHTNDFHSRFGPIDQWNRDCPAAENSAGKCYGGSARLMTAINEARDRSGNSLLLDAGDQFPSSRFSSKHQSALTADLMNQMGYDAMTLGNHEFDDGTAIVLDFIERLKFPVLVSNVDFSAAPQLAALTRKSSVIELGGVRIGLIGVVLEWYEGSSAYRTELTTINATDAVQSEVDQLTTNNVDKIILISHLGYSADEKLANNTTGIDVIVGGHTHTYLSNTYPNTEGPYPTMVNGTALVQTYAYGNFLGELTVTFNDDGNLIQGVGNPIRLDSSVTEDSDIKILLNRAAIGAN